MLYQQRKYFRFLFKASNQHGVHSPFIYNLLTNCLYKKTNKNLWEIFTNVKRQLKNNKNYITITDFGAGSKVFKGNERQVCEIARVAGISDKKAKLLIKITGYFKPKNSLEIGTSLGLGTAAIRIGSSNSLITTLEGCSETSKVAQELFNKNNFKNIKIINGNYLKTLPEITSSKQFDFIYFDGNHTKQATLDYFEKCLKTAHNDSFFIFDDIYWTAEMQEAWSVIKKHPKVQVTVDLFYFGIIFFRKEQAKEHFKLRV
jgi:predicted O-methyltransferase YrrM